ncbi:hypothetical protein PVL29_015087 [Vitis rotundifolia]|uniref:non-specific serine/threonine protein kinase n=1 Tax=Vitis rotundifolia TaxID=103349 RepID=A0AA39DJP5_VITRO|nr:hypothetical protein PVL29_015087 [Vitis rotundifolia]
MGLKLNIAATSLLLLLASAAEVSGDTIFDVTKYGARTDGNSDISQALLKAWGDACSSPVASTVIIPDGTYPLGQIIIAGPCKAPINFVVQGTVMAPVDTSRFRAEAGWIAFQQIDQFTLSGGGVFDGQGKTVWGRKCPSSEYCKQLPINLRFNFITNSMVKDLTSRDSKQFHINLLGCKNLTFYNVVISAPEESLNTDGIHIGRSSGINITDSTIGTGDDCVSIGDGSEQINIQRVTCGPGHGISVGSLGKYPNEEPVVGISVKNCTLTNTQNGVRVKTWPASHQGTASEMNFEDIVMNTVGNPIIIDQEYCPHNQCNLKSPSRIKLSNVSFRNIRGTTSTQVAVKLVCSEEVPCEDVELGDINLEYNGNEGPAMSQCKNIKPNLPGTQLPRISMGLSRILGCLLGCHILFIPFSLLVNALTAYDSAANLSSSWINNGSRDIVVGSENNSTLRPIFLGQGIDASFACGFYCNYNCAGYLFAILIFPPPRKDNYQAVQDPKVVWSANQNFLVRDDATLQLTPDGDLILRDADGTLVWSSNTSGKSVVGLNFTKTGNLVLFDSNNASVWQSFDHPTDSLVPGQILVFGQKLTASASNKDLSQGLISFFITNDSVVACIGSNPPQNYFASSHGYHNSTESRYVIFRKEGLLFPSAQPVFSFPGPFSAQYMKLEPKGHLTFYGFFSHIWKVLLNPLGEFNCAYPMICGKYGICSNQQCFCPRPTAGETRYFTPVNDEEPDLGCKEITPLSCNASHYQSLLMLRSTRPALILRLNKTEIGNETESDIESCKQACLSNCSCKAAVFWSSVGNGGACYLLSEIFSLMKDSHLPRWMTFIKVQDISNPGGPPSSSNPEGPQSSLTSETIINQLLFTFAVFMVLVSIVMIIGRYLILKGKDVKEDGEDKDLLQVPGMPTRFSHEILVVATKNFSRELGKGGFGSVFEGILTDGTKVAVKCINGLSQTKDYFLAEVETIGRIHHLNLVRLVGYCANKSNRCLVYEYMFNGSLDKWIFHRNKELALDWQTRRKIILDIAKGLSYLHEECRQKIIHLDIKPQNILLDESFNAKVSDFGLSKLMDRDQSQVVTTLRGTPGYMAPEWLISAITEKVDVYSFGIVTLEILCGRRNLDHSQPEEDKYLLSLFKRKADEDMQLHGEEAVELMRLAAWCLQNDNDNLDYNFFNSSGLRATEAVHRRQINVGFASPMSPSILSGPR